MHNCCHKLSCCTAAQARQAQQKTLQDLRRSLKFEDVGQVCGLCLGGEGMG